MQARNPPSLQVRLEESPATPCHSSLSLSGALIQCPTRILPLRELVLPLCCLGPAPVGNPSAARSHKFTVPSPLEVHVFFPLYLASVAPFLSVAWSFMPGKILSITCQSPQCNKTQLPLLTAPHLLLGSYNRANPPSGRSLSRVCTEVVTALLVAAEAEVMLCIKSSPFGCCLIVQKALGLLCVKC